MEYHEKKKTKHGFDRRKFWRGFSTVCLALAMILCVFVVSQVLSQGYVSIGGYSVFRVVTPSMEPTLPVGALLLSQEVPISEVQVDDIVVFRSKQSDMLGAVITHRVINILENANGEIFLETKGDNNNYPDASYVEQKNIIGRVVIHTGDGNVFSEVIGGLTSPMGFFAFIVFPCLIVGVVIMRGTIKNIRSEMEVLTQELEEAEGGANKEKDAKTATLEKEMGEQAYQQLCERLRSELLEELKQSADQGETTE
ncbi:MAG: signal peptidase I [Ruminococcaceae bacterium]|nr:signal peptidase I [Oscillospiraceae bacterium]